MIYVGVITILDGPGLSINTKIPNIGIKAKVGILTLEDLNERDLMIIASVPEVLLKDGAIIKNSSCYLPINNSICRTNKGKKEFYWGLLNQVFSIDVDSNNILRPGGGINNPDTNEEVFWTYEDQVFLGLWDGIIIKRPAQNSNVSFTYNPLVESPEAAVGYLPYGGISRVEEDEFEGKKPVHIELVNNYRSIGMPSPLFFAEYKNGRLIYNDINSYL